MTARHWKQKGRSKGDGRFARIMHFMMETPAWRTLPVYERALYLELAKIYDGSNNGRIGLGCRRAAELCNMSVNKANTCFQTLVERGFIEVAAASGFNRKDRQATEWRLTQYRCDRTGAIPSRAFQNWRPDQPKVANDEACEPRKAVARKAA